MFEGDPRRLGKILITGGTGFIGRNLTRRLVDAGCRPTLCARSEAARQRLGALAENVDWLAADLLHPDDTARLVAQSRPETLFHLAGVRSTDPLRCTELNVSATLRLLRTATAIGVRRVVILGSAEEYGNQPGPLHEALPAIPETPYGLTKALATRLAQVLADAEACPVVTLRPFTVYGPGQAEVMFVSQAVRCAVSGAPFRMTEGLQRRDLVHVRDVVQALLQAARADGVVGEVVNVGSGQARRLRDVAELIWRVSGSDAPLQIGARPGPAEELRDTWADTRKAQALLGWQAGINLEAGLRECIDAAQSQGEVER